MTRIESSIEVAQSSERVFAFLNAVENHAKFIPNMAEFRQTSSGAFGQVGATAQGTLNILGVRIKVMYEIIEHETDHRLAMKGVMGPITFKDGYIISPSINGTKVNFWLELTMSGFSRILSPFGGLVGKIHAYETLNNLKKEIEKAGS